MTCGAISMHEALLPPKQILIVTARTIAACQLDAQHLPLQGLEMRCKSSTCGSCSNLFSSHSVSQKPALAALVILSGSHGDAVLLQKFIAYDRRMDAESSSLSLACVSRTRCAKQIQLDPSIQIN